jgi:soluble lytic murein transglycosylase-like protein
MVLVILIFLVVLPLGAGWSSNSTDTATDNQIKPQIDIDCLVDAIIMVESDGRVNCRGRRGEKGLMQIRRPTWRWVCRKILKVNWDFDRYGFDPEKNITVGKAYLWYLSERLQSEEAVICAYNCGITKYLNNQVPPFTLKYLQKVRDAQIHPDTPHFSKTEM